MQRLMLYPLTLLILIAINPICHAQNIFWLNGRWQGKAYFPGSDAAQSYDAVLKVYNIKGNKFEGIIEISQPSDTSARFDSKVSGVVYDKYLIIKRDRILYVKNAPGAQWKISCNNCRPPQMIFSIEKGKFFFRGEVKDCYKECNGITEFSKDITEFDSSGQAAVYALVNHVQNPEVITASIAENNSSLNNNVASSPQEDNLVAKRITVVPAATTIILTGHHTSTSPSLKTTVGSLQENISMKIMEGESKRIPVLSAGTIALSQHNTALASVQSPGGTMKKNPTLIIKESEPKRIPVLTAGSIALSSPNTNLLIHQNQYSLSQKTPSTITGETEQRRIPVLPAGSIVLSKPDKNLSLPQSQLYSMQRTTPSIISEEPEQKRISVLPAGDIVSAKPLRRDTIAMLPAGYAERKKNVVRTLMVNTDSIVLRVYDNGVVDGDIVSVIYNDQVVIDKLSLTARALEIKIPVNKTGINSLVFHAHNLGEFPPNTAKLEILYGNKKEELTVASDLTVSSTINVVHTE